MLKRTTAALVAGAALLLSVVPADAALNAYLTLKGQKQGMINGSTAQKGRENQIEVIAYEHQIVSPRDPASGLPTGKRQHGTFRITKELDRSTPRLYQALVSNENLSEFTLRFWRPSAAGQEVQAYTVKLTNANIASIKGVMDNNKRPEAARTAEYEEIAFTYQKIEWTWNDGGITASDDWAVRN